MNNGVFGSLEEPAQPREKNYQKTLDFLVRLFNSLHYVAFSKSYIYFLKFSAMLLEDIEKSAGEGAGRTLSLHHEGCLMTQRTQKMCISHSAFHKSVQFSNPVDSGY